MSPDTKVEELRQARARVEGARRTLRTPTAEALDETGPDLEAAIATVADLQRIITSGGPLDRQAAREALEALRRELDQLRGMLQFAAAWHTAWSRRLLAATEGYTPTGEPPLPRPASRISVQV